MITKSHYLALWQGLLCGILPWVADISAFYGCIVTVVLLLMMIAFFIQTDKEDHA